MRRGITLIELLLSMTIVVIVTLAATRSLVLSLNYENNLRRGRDAMIAREQFEDKIADLLHHVWISTSATDQNCYFIGGAPSIVAVTGGTTAANGTSTASGTASPNGASGGGGGGGTGDYGTPNTMVFTVAGTPISGALLASNDDFETNNQNFGPQGGPTEVELSQQPVGSGGQGKTGTFLRTQTPADSDPTQGGNEELLSSEVSRIGFEFFDGQNWDQSWDSRQQTTGQVGRLPAAVRITYRFTGDADDHIFVVRIPASDASYLNPVTVTG